MVRMNYFPLLASVIAAFVASSVWYSPLLFGKQFMELSGVGPNAGPSVGKVVGERGRNLILANVLERSVVLLEVVDWKGALNLGLVVDWPSCSTAFGLGHVAKRTMDARRYSRR